MPTLKERNAAFEALPKNEKRVQIAREVIAQLDSEFLTARRGVYVDSDVYVDDPAQQLQKLLKTSAKQGDSCTVCGIGALFVCGVLRGNALTGTQISLDGGDNFGVHGSATLKYLRRYFSWQQLARIESAFERWGKFTKDGNEFARQVYDDETRMRLIMQNIILNNGTFKSNMKVERSWYIVQ